MKYRTLARTGIEVSPYCLGANSQSLQIPESVWF